MIDDIDIDLIGNDVEIQEPIEDKEITEDSKTIIEEPEPTKEDILLKSSGTKAVSEIEFKNNAFNAEWASFKSSSEFFYKVSNIPLGSQYYCYVNGSSRVPASGYFTRGQEIVSSYNGFRLTLYDSRPSGASSSNQRVNVFILNNNNNDLSEIQNQLDVMESAIDYIYDNVYLNQMKIDNNNTLLWEVNDYVQGIPDNPVFVRVFGKSDNNNQNGGVGMVSQNIMTTPINQYGLSDSMSLILILMAVAGLLVYIIHKSIFKWGKK